MLQHEVHCFIDKRASFMREKSKIAQCREGHSWRYVKRKPPLIGRVAFVFRFSPKQFTQLEDTVWIIQLKKMN